MKTFFELEAGSITTKIEKGELKFLTIYRVKMKDVTLPKGHVEDRESLEEASEREALEETGYPVETIDFIDSFEYKVKEKKYGEVAYIIRRVYHFLCKVVGEKTGEENPDEKEGKTISTWLSYEEALNKLSYNNDKDILRKTFVKYNQDIEHTSYSKNIYKQLLNIINNNKDVGKDILKLGIVGSVNDGESVNGWSDLDFLFVIKSDNNGNISTGTLLKLREINNKLSFKYPNIEISFLTHTYDDFQKYVSFEYLENYKYASFGIENDDVNFVNYIEYLVKERALTNEIRKRYSIYHLRHYRFNLIRKVVSGSDNKTALKMIVDKLTETMLLYGIYFDANVKGKNNRKNQLSKLSIDKEIIEIYTEALELRKAWGSVEPNKELIKKWLDNFVKIENFLLKENGYDTPEELINKNTE